MAPSRSNAPLKYPGSPPPTAVNRPKEPVMFGRPNLSGTFTVCTRNEDTGLNEASGAFSLSDGGGKGDIYGLGAKRPKWDFSANRSSSVYGGSTTVQPPAIRFLPCLKT